MDAQTDRRAFLGAVGAAATAGTLGYAAEAAGSGPLTILGLCCSPRKGKTTAAALTVALDAAREAGGGKIATELIELAGLNIPVFDPAAKDHGDFDALVPKIANPAVAGIIIGTPVYMGGMTSLCKALLDHFVVFRKNKFALRNKVGGVLAVGGGRNGGQLLAIQGVQTSLMCQDMILVGDGQPTAHTGGALVNTKDDISGDETGLETAKNLGRRVAEAALRMTGTSPA